MRYLMIVLLLVVGCGADDAPPTCDELHCEALACGSLTPDGVTHPELCTCTLPEDAGFVGCEVRQ